MGAVFPHTVRSIFRLSLTRFVRLSGLADAWRRGPADRSWSVFMHDCFAVELTGECLKCLFRLT